MIKSVYSDLRYTLGDMPYFFLKRRLKYERLAKPVSYVF